MKLNVQIKLTRGQTLPAYATDGSAAVDLRAALDAPVEIAPGGRAMIPTGVDNAPETRDVVAIVAARSGLAVKKGICLSNGIGVIDADYRGEICVGLLNTSAEAFTVTPGDRIAQLMFLPVLAANFLPVEELDETARGAGGFGSTGVK